MQSRVCSLFLATSLLLISAPGSAGLWTDWEWLNPRPQGHWLGSLASSESVVVSVGQSGTILTSENGVNWDIVHSKSGLYLQDVVWACDRFIAVGGYSLGLGEPAFSPGVILTSMDGQQWTEDFVVSGTIFRKVIFNGAQILAVGFKGKTATSQDGVNWSEHLLEEYPNSEIVDVAWDGSTYVGIGVLNYFSGGMAVYLSQDGISWTRTPLEGIPAMSLLSIVWGHDRFLVFGGVWPNIPLVLSSTDGQHWTEESTNLAGFIREAIATPEGYLGVGDGGRVYQSTDGLSWTFSTAVPENRLLFDIAWFEGKYITVGEEGAIALSTDGGHPWEVVTSWAIDFTDSNEIDDLCWADGVLIAISDHGAVFRSTDGFEWQQVAFFSGGIYSVEWFNEAFWVVGYSRLIAHSVDGVDWTTRREEPGATYVDIANSDEVTVAAGRMTGGSALVGTSTDGFSWTDLEIDDATGLVILSVTWTGTRFVGVGSGGSIFRSDDGYQWELELLDSVASLWRVASNGMALVAVGPNEDILTSDDDGLTWLPTLGQGNYRDVIWTGEWFVVAEGLTIHSSRNGHDWISTPVPSGSARFIASQGREIVFSGSGENLMRAELVNYVPPQEFAQEIFLD